MGMGNVLARIKTPGVNFNNVLRAAFAHKDPKNT